MRRTSLAFAVAFLNVTAIAWGATIHKPAALKHRPETTHVNIHKHQRQAKHQVAASPTGRATRKHATRKKHPAGKKATASTSATIAFAATTTAAAPHLFGEQSVEPTIDSNAAGTAESFPFTDATAGTAQTISVYVDSHNRATTMIAALYSDNHGQPGTLLRAGSLSSPKAAAWNTVSIGALPVIAGTKYWIAALGKGGDMFFRDQANGACHSDTSNQSNLAAAPTTWTNGIQWNSCFISAYVGGTTTPVTTTTTTTATTATPPPPPLPPLDVVAPQISGTTTEGQTLSDGPGSWTGSPTSFSYQWINCDTLGIVCNNIGGATGSTYTLTANDVGDTMRVAVTATNGAGSTSATSAQTATVSAQAAPTNTAAPQISGTATQGQTLSTSNGTWTGSPTSFSYQWQDCNTSGSACANITGATATSYAVTANNVGDTIRAVVTAGNDGGATAANSAQTATVPASPPAAPTNTAAPQISGTTTQGQTLSTSNGSWTGSPSSYSYKWQDCNTSGSGCANISGATGTSYTLTANDDGNTIRAMVTATNTGGSASGTSTQSATVSAPATPAPTNTAAPQISGTATQGQTLSTSHGTWTGSPTSFSYRWQDCNTSGSACANITGATTTSYTLTANDVGDTIRAAVTATNAGGSASGTSTQTATVAASGGTGGQRFNCAGTTSSGSVSYASLDNCGYPSPNTTGVPTGTTLTSVGSINCSNTTINAVSTSGSVSIGSNCTITNSRMTGGMIVIQGGTTGVNLSHDEISGPYTGSPTSPNCSYSSSNGNDVDVQAESSASAVTLNYDYLHCAAEPFNGEGTVRNSYIIADECWGPCGSGSTTHNEAMYIPGGSNGGTNIDHNTLLNPWSQTAGIFGDDHAYGPIKNLTINNNLVAAGGDNGAIATGNAGDGNAGVNITNNRLSYVYSNSMPSGGSSAATWSGNYRDDTGASVASAS